MKTVRTERVSKRRHREVALPRKKGGVTVNHKLHYFSQFRDQVGERRRRNTAVAVKITWKLLVNAAPPSGDSETIKLSGE